MRLRLHPLILAVCLLGICTLSLAAIYIYRWRSDWGVPEIVSSLPYERGVLVFIDVNKLRGSGYLDMFIGSPAIEELEYRGFVEETRFDYRQDLDRLALVLTDDGDRFAVATGRFDWKRLSSYTQQNKGRCHNGFCEIITSQFGRSASFYPIKSSAMAFAAAKGTGGAYLIKPGTSSKHDWPDDPVWIRVPGTYFGTKRGLPDGSSMFASALAGASQTLFRVRPAERGAELTAEMFCKDDAAASDMVKQLEEATQLLRKMLARQNQKASASDLSGVLVSGTFRKEGTLVTARWPLDREFLRNLAGGGI